MGELLTYSLRTLNYLARYIERIEKKGETLPYIIMSKTMKAYGFDSIEEAEIEIKKNMGIIVEL